MFFDRTPIHGILGLTVLLLESELTADQKESLLSLKECADLLLHIINSVLDLAKIEAGRLEVETVPFTIRKMVSSTLRMMQARARAHGLQLLWDIGDTVPDMVVGDPGKLQQCLLNLGIPSLAMACSSCPVGTIISVGVFFLMFLMFITQYSLSSLLDHLIIWSNSTCIGLLLLNVLQLDIA